MLVSEVRLPRLSALLQARAKNSRWKRTRELPVISSAPDAPILFRSEAGMSGDSAGMASVLRKAVSKTESARELLGSRGGGGVSAQTISG